MTRAPTRLVVLSVDQRSSGLRLEAAVSDGLNLVWTQIARKLLPWQHP